MAGLYLSVSTDSSEEWKEHCLCSRWQRVDEFYSALPHNPYSIQWERRGPQFLLCCSSGVGMVQPKVAILFFISSRDHMLCVCVSPCTCEHGHICAHVFICVTGVFELQAAQFSRPAHIRNINSKYLKLTIQSSLEVLKFLAILTSFSRCQSFESWFILFFQGFQL